MKKLNIKKPNIKRALAGTALTSIGLTALTGIVTDAFNTSSPASLNPKASTCMIAAPSSAQDMTFTSNGGTYTYGPRIEGQNTCDQDDLDASIPGTGIALGGDGVHGYPQIHVPGVYDGYNPLPVPKYNGTPPHGAVVGPHGESSRPVPTGTALGPHGEHYAFYAIVPYQKPDGKPTTDFTAPDTVVVDLAHPGKPLFTLHGISQASGAYDRQSGRMIILGNTPSGHRALWQSEPVGKNAAWNTTLQQLGTFSGAMDGNRESQIVALPKGGFLVVGAGTSPERFPLPIQSVTAATPQGLLAAEPTALVTPQAVPQVYGPTITDIKEINGKTVVTMRVSTFGGNHYNPHTYKTAFTVTNADPGRARIAAMPPRV